MYLALCYHVYAWSLVVPGLLSEEDVGCVTRKGENDAEKTAGLLVSGSLDNTACVLIFMAGYYFSTASHLWWVVLTVSWFLSACKKWSPEALQPLSSYFHFVAWGLPALLTIGVLVTHNVGLILHCM